MKKLFIIGMASVVAGLFSCSQSPEEKRADEKEIYIEKAEKYISNKIASDENNEITKYSNIQVDSIKNLSEYDAKWVEVAPLYKEYIWTVNHASEMQELDPRIDGELSVMTVNAIDDATALNKKYEVAKSEVEKSSKKKIVGKEVKMFVDLHRADGTVEKKKVLYFYFDADNDLPKKWNS